MRLDDQRESDNFEIERGGGGGGFGGGNMLGFLLPLIGSRFGLGGIVIVGIIMLMTGGNPLGLLGGGGGMQQGGSVSREAAQLTDIQHWSLRVLGSTEDVWGQFFARSGQRYQPTILHFYSRTGMSGCGAAQSAMGPFYCPNDGKVYLDTEFFTELKQRFGSPGDFAQAYVIAHEVGHHIQDLEGTLGRIHSQQAQAGEEQGNALQVRVELQADCYAGVWGKLSGLMEPGDIEEGVRAAHAIGDDILMQQAGRTPVESMFTHGSAEQRMRWLRKGLETGDPAQCDTFSGAQI